jgi:alcohol dehydrogenase class IV
MITRFNSFSIARLPRIEFGSGKFDSVADIASQYGRRVLVVTGARSFQATLDWRKVQQAFNEHNTGFEVINVAREPSPQLVDDTVAQYADDKFDVVLGIGGGSALDAAKAIAGLLRVNRTGRAADCSTDNGGDR